MCHIELPVSVTALSGYEVQAKILVNGATAGVAYNIKPNNINQADVVYINTADQTSSSCLMATSVQGSGQLNLPANYPCPVQVRQGKWAQLTIKVADATADIYYEGVFVAQVSTTGNHRSAAGLVVVNGGASDPEAHYKEAYTYDATKNVTSCPDEWTHNQVSGACYHTVHDWWTYEDAHDYCLNNHSAALIKIDDEREMDFIDNWLFYNYEDHWTSATDLVNDDGEYGWNNDTEPVGFMHWFSRDTPHEDDGECMYLLKNIYWNGWYMNRFEYEDYNCSETKHFICEKPAIQCSAPPTVLNARMDSSLVHIGSIVTYTCHVGHEFPDNVESRSMLCKQEGKWSCEPQDCQLKECPKEDLAHLLHAVLSTTRVTYDTRVEVTCFPGWIFPDNNVSHVLTCQDNRQWDFVPDDCERVICPNLPVYPNMTVNVTGGTEYESEVDMTCDPGFMFPDRTIHRHLECSMYANWTMEAIPCVELDCPALDYEFVNISSSATSMGSIVDLKCAAGHEWPWPHNASAHHVKCERNAFWNMTYPDCTAKHCPPIPGYFGAVNNDTKYGTKVELECQIGDIFADQSYTLSTICGALGNWFPLALECYEEIDLKKFYSSKPVEAPAAEAIGAMQIILMLAGLALIIVMDIDTFYRSRHWIRRNWRDARWRVEQERDKLWKEEDAGDFSSF